MSENRSKAAGSSFVIDMTKGNSMQLILKFTLPLLVGNLFQQVYNVVDSIVVGRHLGANALGGVGSVGLVNFMFFSLCSGMASGIGVVISGYFGAKKEDEVKKAIANALYVILAAGILMSVLSLIFARGILTLMNTPEENFSYAYTYMRIMCGFTFVVAIYNGISAILRALGDSKTPLIFLVVASVINVILDILLVIVLDCGVAGAAYATVFSQFVSGIGSILFAVKKNPYFMLKKEHFKFDKQILQKDFRIGIPMSIQTAMISISCVLLQTLINGYGATVMAAYTATGKVESVIFQPYSSLGIAMSTFAGQNVGAKDYKRIKKAIMQAMGITLAFSLILFVVILLFRENIIAAFVVEKDVIEIGSKALIISGSMYFALGTIYTLRGVLNGMGDVFFSMLNGILEVGGRIFFAVVLMYVFKLGFWGVWYTNVLTWVVIASSAAVRLVFFFRKKERAQS